MKQRCRTFVHIIQLWFTNRQEKLSFVNWYLYAMRAEEIDPTLVLFSVEDWYRLRGYNKSQSNWLCSAERST